ncbi:MAG: tyrosine-protein phosphatase [Bacteroidales bacterium]|jgi:protein-tyrosine phosphatase|nr:tyrosine-protein phosphatase [Bacteroidales bacterium]
MKWMIFIFIMLFVNNIEIDAQRRPTGVKREVTLEGGFNCRDLGGYETTGGQRLAMGKLYRSAHLSRLTDHDLIELKQRKIYTVLDFRSKQEVADAPDRLLPGTVYLNIPSGNINDSATFAQNKISGFDMMIAFYSDISGLKERFRPFFQQLVTQPDTGALLFHCAIGKDRTGIAAALLLYALDVPMETIMADYTATNFFMKDQNNAIAEQLVTKYGIEQATAAQITEAHPAFLRATFEAINRKYGSVEAFFNIELGVNEMVKMMLRRKYLL